MKVQSKDSRVSTAGLLIALGIIYGDMGTSPLYVMKAIIGDDPISETLVYGGISCVFWTLTLQTTLKYVLLTLQADNNGEGGIFSLYTLIRRKAAWLIVPAMIGGAALLADGIITPPISISSAVEGLRILYPHIPTVPIILAILTGLFLLQSFGTEIVGMAFGPIMLLWFTMLASLGVVSMLDHPEILQALNPYYAYNLLANYPSGFWLLGAVFLCTTGAEALYSDLGHCGRPNIRLSWIFVKAALVLNYLGQGAWLMTKEGELLNQNPFYGLMPSWFLLTGITIGIIASQALISGAFTLISEAIRLNLWPRVQLRYPTNLRGQLYVPSVNWLLWLGFRVEQRINLFFRKVVEELVDNGEVDIISRYQSLSRQHLIGDFRFVVLEKFLSYENELPFRKRKIMEWYFAIKHFAISESKWFGLDTSSVKVEKVPLVIMPAKLPELKRVTV